MKAITMLNQRLRRRAAKARDLQLPGKIRRLTDHVRKTRPTLREAVATAEERLGRTVAGMYPQGRQAVLDGLTSLEQLPPIPGFGDQPLSAFTWRAVGEQVPAVRERASLNVLRRRKARPARPESELGLEAARQYVRAARAIGAALSDPDVGLVGRNPMEKLHEPARPGKTRPPDYSPEELCQVVQILLTHDRDPQLMALIWSFLRATGGRRCAAVGATVAGIDVGRGTVVLVRRGAPTMLQVVSRPLLAACLALHLERDPELRIPALFLTKRGLPISNRYFDTRSRWVHADAEFARGHDIGEHALRHTTARQVYAACGDNSIATSMFLGLSLKARHGTTGEPYLSPYAEYDVRRAAAEKTFGSLDAWPNLLELKILRHVIDIDAVVAPT